MQRGESMVTPRQAAQMRRVSLSYIYYELWANRIPGAIKAGKEWRIPRDVIEEKARHREVEKAQGSRQ